MAQGNSREMVLVPITTSVASSTSGVIVIPEDYTCAVLLLVCSAASGTSPTLNVRIQHAITGAGATDLAGGQATGTVVYADVVSFTQVVAAANVSAFWKGTASVAAAVTDGTLAAGTVSNGPLGRAWRVKWTIAGTNPGFTWSLTAQFLPL